MHLAQGQLLLERKAPLLLRGQIQPVLNLLRLRDQLKVEQRQVVLLGHNQHRLERSHQVQRREVLLQVVRRLDRLQLLADLLHR